MARICLISPGHLSTNPRLVKEARALKAAGFHVHAVHGQFSSWGTRSDIPLADEIGATVAVPFGPTEANRLTYLRQTLARRAAVALSRSDVTRAFWAEYAHAPIVSDLKSAAAKISADLYIAHYVAALPAAARAARRHGAIYAFDAEDFHLGDLPDVPEHAFEKKIIRTIEGRYLPGAAYVSAASPMIAEAYAETYGIPTPATILNVFPKRNVPTAPTPKGSAEPGPSIYWFSQTIGPGRGLETAVEAIARATSHPHLYLRGTLARGYADDLRRLAQGAGVAARLHLLPSAPPDDLERLGAAYDVGYSGEMGFSPNRLRALTNKLFSYVLGGVPILASDIPSHRRIAPEFGAAITLFPIGDAAALAAAMDGMLLNPGRLAEAREHAWRLGQERYNWDCEQQKLLVYVEEALSRGSGL